MIALGAGAGLALSTFVGYLAAGRLVTFLPLEAVAWNRTRYEKTATIYLAGSVAVEQRGT
ncbi:hypothetical protein [Streptomyces sp. NPDC058475]|uniref:hypothetical protein n=1 Tax=Streptomyces sp. NPDC058475 TaxID=3346518 RepID=UPI00366872D2